MIDAQKLLVALPNVPKGPHQGLWLGKVASFGVRAGVGKREVSIDDPLFARQQATTLPGRLLIGMLDQCAADSRA